MPKVFIVDGGKPYQSMFVKEGWTLVYNAQDADLVQFTGGSDVSPSYYGELPHPATRANKVRDEREAGLFEYCVKARKPMAGICRGGQFLHVMNDGDMWQDVDSHAIHGTHSAFSPNGDVILQVTSTHHQMMRMNGGDGEVLLIADECKRPKEHMFEGEVCKVNGADDIEAVYYKDTQAFCFQPHPEMSSGMQCRDFYFRKLFKLFGLKGE